MKIALVHDYLIDFGGAERVLLAFHKMFPKAPVYVSIYRPSLLGKFSEEFKSIKIVQSWFGYIPFANKLISPFRFLLPLIWKSFDLKEYDLIISSASWAVTKGFEKKKGGIEICYCHTPPRYLYGYDTSRRSSGIFGKLVNAYAVIVNHFMRMYDFNQAQKVDHFIANSKEVQKRIQKFYRRKSTVIYPPVEVGDVQLDPNIERQYYLAGGRLTAAKNFDIIIKAFNKLKLPLKIYGDGILKNELRNIADENIEFLGEVEDSQLAKLYNGAEGFVLAQKDEDFGMTAVEAQAQGCPVIAYKGGGYLESVVENKSGVFFENLDPNSLVDAIKKIQKIKFDPNTVASQVSRFNRKKFEEPVTIVIKNLR